MDPLPSPGNCSSPTLRLPTFPQLHLQDVLVPPVNSELIAARIPGAEHHVFSGWGHAFKDPSGFLEPILRFLDSTPVASGAAGAGETVGAAGAAESGVAAEAAAGAANMGESGVAVTADAAAEGVAVE